MFDKLTLVIICSTNLAVWSGLGADLDAPMTDHAAKRTKRETTLASDITEELRRDIISGSLAPGGKIRLRQVAERFGVGMSPVREALNRLARDRLVNQSDLRGFRVAPISADELDELMRARCWLNETGLRESIKRGGAVWEEAVLLSFHRLSRVPDRLPEPARAGNAAMNPQWEAAHRVFHRSLLEACGSRWIVEFCDQLFDVADIYRHVARASPLASSREPVDEHRAIMEAAIARDADRAVDLLNRHFLHTVTLYHDAVATMTRDG
jgi:GntR family transcriptional regulator, carbon starvation induced regulator